MKTYKVKYSIRNYETKAFEPTEASVEASNVIGAINCILSYYSNLRDLSVHSIESVKVQ